MTNQELHNFLGSAVTYAGPRVKFTMPSSHELPPRLRRDDIRAGRDWLMWKFGLDDDAFQIIHEANAILIFQLVNQHHEGGWEAFVA